MGLLAWTLCVLTVGVLIVTNQPKTVAGETNLSCILDVAVVVDMAITDDQGKAAALQDFIQQFSDLIGVSEDGSHIGVMNVDATANTLLSLTEGLSIEAVANAFAGMQSGESRTGDLSLNLSSAIKKAYEEILSTSNNRQEVPDAVLVITDGSTSISSTLDNAVSSAVSIVVVGVGPTADSSALSSIASSGSFFAVSVSANWSAIAGDVEAALCNVKQPLLPVPVPGHRSPTHFLCKPHFVDFRVHPTRANYFQYVYREKCGCIKNDNGHVVPSNPNDPFCECCQPLGCPLNVEAGGLVLKPIKIDYTLNQIRNFTRGAFYCKPCFDGYENSTSYYRTYKEKCGCVRRNDQIVPAVANDPLCECCSEVECVDNMQIGEVHTIKEEVSKAEFEAAAAQK